MYIFSVICVYLRVGVFDSLSHFRMLQQVINFKPTYSPLSIATCVDDASETFVLYYFFFIVKFRTEELCQPRLKF